LVYAQDIDINAQSAVLIDADTGRILWGRDEHRAMAMASTTKIMTAIITIENCNLKDVVTVGKNPTLAPKVKMNLSVGEKITLEQLLYALLMQSSNDAAVAIAEYVSGDVDRFCQKMTEKARSIGCKDTLFETPNGLDKGNHHSTAYDMALIGAYAIKNSEFMRISNTKTVHFQTNKTTYDIVNKNQLLNTYQGAMGIKTGFTGKAGHCFVGAAKRGNVTLISTVLACGWGSSGKAKKWSDTKKLLDYGFNNYEVYSVIGQPFSADVINSKKTSINVEPDGFIELLLKKDKSEKIDFVRKIETPVTAPVHKGDKLGELVIMAEGFECGRINVIASEDIEENNFRINFEKIYFKWLKLIV
jgi:serine-type D-ala-D-ala carboxypeptidase